MTTKINAILAASLSTLLVAGASAGLSTPANAAGTQYSPSSDDNMSTGAQAWQPTGKIEFASMKMNYTPEVGTAIKMSKGGDYSVRNFSTLSNSEQSDLKDIKQNEPQHVAQLQSSIRSNTALTKSLQRQNVEIGNIVDAQRAADGSLIFYTL